jgi:hypothetical protein
MGREQQLLLAAFLFRAALAAPACLP